jgi:chorismate lyase/3-hydroxybenzoate synthase
MESPTSSVASGTSSALCAEKGSLAPPPWVWELLGRDARRLPKESEEGLDVVQGGGFRLASLRVPGVRGLGRTALQAAVSGAYRRLEAALRGLHPVRWWNHIPGIHDPLGDGQDLYMVFNAGRYEALAAWLGKESFDTRVASASGVGHEGRDLVIHCLAADRPGRAVDNPRQIAPYRYSRRYGRLPPCFARATVIQPSESNPLVLVGGTASIVGEASVHLGDLQRQTEETLANLAVLLRAAAGDPATEVADRAGVLAGFRELRVYDPIPERRDELRLLLQDAFPRVRQIEWVRADLCRRELLVEIEGLAELNL